MKLKTAAIFGILLPAMAMAEQPAYPDRIKEEEIAIYPESGTVDSLCQVTVTTDHPEGFGAFVYMPSLYAINEDGSMGKEVSACVLMDESARGKETLHFRVLDPPTKAGKYAFMIKDNSFTLNADKRNDDDLLSPSAESTKPQARISKDHAGNAFRNYPVDLESDTLRILHISNSYGGNLLHYVNALLKAADVDDSNLLVERLMYSSGTFKNWVDVHDDNNPNTYSYFKMAGSLSTNMTGWEGAKYDGSKFRMMLAENKWDLIIINQGSLYAPYYENWDLTGAGGYLPELLKIIRTYQPETPVGMLLVHSYAKDYASNTQHWTSAERWERIRNGVEWLATAYDIDFVIPYGTAIENLRLTSYNTPHELTGDGSHLAGGLALYTAGCCYYERIFGPRLRQSVWGNPLRIPNPEVQFSDKHEEEIIPVDEASAATAQKAAFLSCRNMYEPRNPEQADLSDYRYGEALNPLEYRIDYQVNGEETMDSMHTTGIYRVYGPTGLLIDGGMTEEEWRALPKGLYIRNGEKIYKK